MLYLCNFHSSLAGGIVVIICAVLIFFADKNTAKYIDPIMSLISTSVIMILSYPYSKYKKF